MMFCFRSILQIWMMSLGFRDTNDFVSLSICKQSAENRRKERHRFWLRLLHAVILISNDRTSASKKINEMALIRTLTVSTTAFDRTREKFCGFRQTVNMSLNSPAAAIVDLPKSTVKIQIITSFNFLRHYIIKMTTLKKEWIAKIRYS